MTARGAECSFRHIFPRPYLTNLARSRPPCPCSPPPQTHPAYMERNSRHRRPRAAGPLHPLRLGLPRREGTVSRKSTFVAHPGFSVPIASTNDRSSFLLGNAFRYIPPLPIPGLPFPYRCRGFCPYSPAFWAVDAAGRTRQCSLISQRLNAWRQKHPVGPVASTLG